MATFKKQGSSGGSAAGKPTAATTTVRKVSDSSIIPCTTTISNGIIRVEISLASITTNTDFTIDVNFTVDGDTYVRSIGNLTTLDGTTLTGATFVSAGAHIASGDRRDRASPYRFNKAIAYLVFARSM